MSHTNDFTTNNLLSMVVHGAALFTSFLISVVVPIIILNVADDYVVKENARESLNFQFSVWIYVFVAVLLKVVGIGFILLAIVGLFALISPIVAMIHVANNPRAPYRYPGILRFIG